MQATLNIDKLGKSNNKYGSFKATDGEYYSYPIGAMNPKEGTRVVVEYDDNVKDGKTYHNITREILQPLPQGGDPAPANQGRYDLQSKIITRSAIAKSMIEALQGQPATVATFKEAQRWLDWCEGRYIPSAPSAPPPQQRRPHQPTHPDPDGYNQGYDDLDDEIPFN